MRALRIVLIALALLMALVCAGAWFGPAMLDWGRYRVAIAALASSALGRPVRIDGAVTLRLLPEPILTASSITVAGTSGEDTSALSVERLRLRVALGPLLAGRVDARELVLERPELHLPWPLDVDSLPARPSWLASVAARIEDGTLVLGTVTTNGVDASVTTDPDTDALVTAGAARLFGLEWSFTARLGMPGGDRSTTLEATLDGQGPVRDTGGRFSGQIAADGSLQGQISGRGPNLSQILPAPAVPWRADGRLTAAGGLAAADDLSLEIAGSPARGAVALRVAPMPRLDLALAASRLDLDSWLPVMLHGTTGGLATGIDLSAEAASLAGGTLRGLRSAFDLGPDGVVVRDASAILPGEASLRLSGAVPSRPESASGSGQAASFRGSATISLPDLRTTLRWLRDAYPGLPASFPPDVLRSGQFAAMVTLDRRSAAFANLSGTIDGTALTGNAMAVFGDQPALDVSLQLDRLDLDAWVPDAGAAWGAMPRLASVPDTELRLRAGQATWRGIRADGVSINASLKSGRLGLRLLDGTVQGIHVALSTTVSPTGRIADAQLNLTAEHADPLADLLRYVALDPGVVAPPALFHGALFHGPMSLRARASGPDEALSAHVELDLADARLVAQPVVNLATGEWSGTVTLHHPGAPRILEMLGVAGAGNWLGDGSLSLISQVTSAPGRLSADRFELTAGALRAEGRLLLEQGDGGPRLSGQIAAETLPLPMPLSLAGLSAADPLPFHLLRGWRADLRIEAAQVLGGGATLLSHASAQFGLASGRLRIDRLAATWAGGTLSADARVDAVAEPPRLALQGRVAGASAGNGLLDSPVDLRDGSVDATFDLQAQGHGPDALLSTLAGNAQISAKGGRLCGFDTAGANAALGATQAESVLSGVRAALTTGVTPFEKLDVPITFTHGIATVARASLAARGGTATLDGAIDLTVPSIDLLAGVKPARPDSPDLRVRLIGPLDAPAHVPDLTDLTKWLSRRP